jgi:hypothetical protein
LPRLAQILLALNWLTLPRLALSWLAWDLPIAP